MRKIICAIAASAVLGCSGDGSSTGPGDSGNTSMTVTVGNNSFAPATLNVPVNSTVTWTWNPGGVDHNVTFPTGSNSATQSSGSFSRIFPTIGTYTYVCTIHQALGMTGVINVTASTGGTGGDGGGGGGYGVTRP